MSDTNTCSHTVEALEGAWLTGRPGIRQCQLHTEGRRSVASTDPCSQLALTAVGRLGR